MGELALFHNELFTSACLCRINFNLHDKGNMVNANHKKEKQSDYRDECFICFCYHICGDNQSQVRMHVSTKK